MKNQADKNPREITFDVEELISLKLQSYKLKTLAKKLNEKVDPRFSGPYKILRDFGMQSTS